MLRAAVVLVLLLPLAGCLRAQLRTPVENLRVELAVMADACKTDGYSESPCSEALQGDLDAAAKQAEHLDAIVKNREPQ